MTDEAVRRYFGLRDSDSSPIDDMRDFWWFTLDFEAFNKAIRDNPNDHATRAVFADWLEDRGCLLLAEYHRRKIPEEATP